MGGKILIFYKSLTLFHGTAFSTFLGLTIATELYFTKNVAQFLLSLDCKSSTFSMENTSFAGQMMAFFFAYCPRSEFTMDEMKIGRLSMRDKKMDEEKEKHYAIK